MTSWGNPMHWKSTLLLILLAGGVGAWLWKGDEWAVRWGLRAAPEPGAADSPSVKLLASEITPAKVTRIEIPMANGSETLVLERNDVKSEWKMPGQWPARPPVVAELVSAITDLRTRFAPIALTTNASLKPYGLASSQGPIAVKVDVGGTPHTLVFGQAESTSENPFTRPTYLRIDDKPEVIRLGPEVFALLQRPIEDYRKRQVFPEAQRVRLEATRPPVAMPRQPPTTPGVAPIVGDAIESVEVIGPNTSVTLLGLPIHETLDGRYMLRRIEANPKAMAKTAAERSPAISNAALTQAWEVRAPARHAVEPDHLRLVLTQLPELWATDFPLPEAKRRVLSRDFAALLGAGAPLASLEATLVASRMAGSLDTWFLARSGLANPERRVLVTKAGSNSPTELRIGNLAETKTNTERQRYAMLANNPAVFLVKADRLDDLFVKAATVRDSRLARFVPEDAVEVSIERAGQATKLARTRGNPKASVEAEKKDRWYLADGSSSFLADESKVKDVVTLLSGLDTPANRQSFTAAPPKGSKVTLRTREPRPDGQPEAPVRTYTFLLSEPIDEKESDGKAKPQSVQVALEGWPRVDTIDNSDSRVSKVIDRPSVAYRSRKLFDTATAKLSEITVKEPTGETFSLSKADTGDAWTLTQPPAGLTDPAKTTQLTNTLSDLEVEKFLAASSKPEDLAKLGLDKPSLTVGMNFTEKGSTQKHTLEIGKPVERAPGTPPTEKPQVYARLDGQTVFTIPATVVDSLKEGALALLPSQVFPKGDSITRLEVKRGKSESKEAYTLASVGNDWNLSGPFTTIVSKAAVDPAINALASLSVNKYEVLAATKAEQFGFDKPTLTVSVQFQPKEPGAPLITRTLVIGKPTADQSSHYAQVLGGANQAVFTVAPSVMNALDRPALALVDTKLLTLDPAIVQGIAFGGPKPEDALTLNRTATGWVASGQDFQVDSNAIERLLRRLANFQVDKIVGYGPDVKWAERGLAPPARSIAITVSGQKPGTHTIAFGAKDTTGDRYTRIDGGPALAVVYAGEAANLTPSKLDFVDRTLLLFPPQEFNGLVRIKGKDELAIEPGTTQGWDIVKPVKQKADSVFLEGIEGLDESRGLIRTLSDLRARSIAAFGPKSELARFGLDNPVATFTLKVGNKPEEKVLKLGNLVDAAKPEGDRYAYVEGAGPNVTVGVLPGSLGKDLLAEPIFFRDRGLAKFRDADRLTLVRGDRTVSFARVMGTWRMLEPVRVEAEHNDLEDFVNILTNLRADEILNEKPGDLAEFGLEKPQARWTVSNRGKEELSLLIGKTVNGRAFAKVEKGDNVVALSAKDTNRVLGEYRKRKVWEGVDATQVPSVVISSADRTFQLSKFGQVWEDPGMPGDRISVAAVNDFLAALRDLSASRYISDVGADPKLYGLEKPQRVIVLTQSSPMGGATTKTLRIGAAEGGSDGKRYYAAVDEPGRSEVFVISEAEAARLMKDRTDFLEKK